MAHPVGPLSDLPNPPGAPDGGVGKYFFRTGILVLYRFATFGQEKVLVFDFFPFIGMIYRILCVFQY